MFYFWQGYQTRKIGEGIYKNSLYYHNKFSVHLKLFQNKLGIFFLITIERDLLLWSKQQILDGMPVASWNIGESFSIFTQAKEDTYKMTWQRSYLRPSSSRSSLGNNVHQWHTPPKATKPAFYMLLDHHSTVCGFGL